MASLHRIWKDPPLRLTTKLRVYQALVLFVLLYAAEIWTLLATDMKALEAFHMKCQRQILGIRWSDFVSNVDVQARTGLMPLAKSWRPIASQCLDTLPGLRVMFLRT